MKLGLKRVQILQKEWAEREYGDIKNMIKTTERKLAWAQKQTPNANMLVACNTMANELDGLHRVEEAYWHLRSRVNELKDGDKNTKYFHHKANSRKKRNLIRGLMDDDGNWRMSKTDIERLVLVYFESIFAADTPYGFPEALQGIVSVVNDDMNQTLDEEPTKEDIHTSLFQIHPT